MTTGGSDPRDRRVDVDCAAPIAVLLQQMWGDELPPGAAAWHRVAADVLGFDDANGRRRGLAVQDDVVSLEQLVELLSYVPGDAAIRSTLPRLLTELAGDGHRDARVPRDPEA